MKYAPLLLLAGLAAVAQGGGGGGGGGRQRTGPPPAVYRTEVPAHPYDLVIGQVTRSAATVSVLCYADSEGTLSWGTAPGKWTHSLPAQKFPKDVPVPLEINGLSPGTRYYWRVRFASDASDERTFTTLRPKGSAFTFSVQADSHLDGGSVAAVYRRSLNAVRDTDFLVDLGDTFMTDKYPRYTDAHPQYVAQRYYFDLARVPLFLVLGNHDGEAGRWRDGSPENMADWARRERKRYFPNPTENYWAFESGDALFVALDPYWFTTGGGRRDRDDNWYRTLGKTQYDWLKTTLEKSKARWKFVFIHNLVGGLGKDGRGGAEAAPFCEWGGKNSDGTDGFAQHRPDWPMPIHQLLVRNGVTAVFHGHDHLFAHQTLDGIVYQETPQPSHGHGGAFQSAGEYGYTQGTLLEGSGVLKVTVGPEKAQVVFLRTDDTETPTAAYRYDLPGKTK